MDYPHLVRTALTRPSGRLRDHVSVEEYCWWMAHAIEGSFLKLFPQELLTPAYIFSEAARTTWATKVWLNATTQA